MCTLQTERLILRRYNKADLEDFYYNSSNPDVGPNAGWKPHESMEESETILKEFIESPEIWAIVYKENNKVIGSIGLHIDRKRRELEETTRSIGYAIGPEYWGKGIAAEATKALIKYGFESLNLELLAIYHYPFNKRSKRVIEKSGFKFEGILRKASKIYNGEIYDDWCYSITKEEYEESISN